MDTLRRRLYGSDGEAIALKPKVFDTLLYLVEHAGELLDKSTLMKGVWGDVVVEENSLNQHISTLRRALGEAPGDNRFIVTVQRRGYRFVAAVREVPEKPGVAAGQEPATIPVGHTDRAGIVRLATIRLHRPVALAVALIALASGIGAAFYFYPDSFDSAPGADRGPTTAEIAPNSVAVLPFDNASDQDDLYLSITEGLGDHLREYLSRLPGSPLQVTWRSSSRMFGADEELASVAASLRANYVIHGRLSRLDDDLLRTHVGIFEADGGTVWEDEYEFVVDGLLSIQEEIARDVAAHLVQRDVQTAVTRTPEANEELAHRLVTIGRLNELRVRDALVVDDARLAQAIDAYRRATVADPDSAEAHSRLAAALLYRGEVEAAETPLNRALDLEPDHSETWYTLALYRMRLGLGGLGAAFENAIASDPGNADALGAYGLWLWGHGNAAGAQQYLESALKLDRLTPTRWSDYVEYLGGNNQREALLGLVDEIRGLPFADPQRYRLLARLYELTGDLDEGIAWALRAYREQPDDTDTLGQIAELYTQIGDIESASRYEPEPGIGQLFLQGKYDELIAVAEERVLDGMPPEPNVWYFLAFAHGVTGAPDLAKYVLEQVRLPQIVMTESYTPAETQALTTYISALQATGDVEEARRYAIRGAEILQSNVDSGMGDAWWPNTYLACVRADLDETGEALDALDRVRTRSAGLPWASFLKDAPCFRNLRDQPGYQALITDLEDRRARLRDKLPETLDRHGLSSLRTSAIR